MVISVHVCVNQGTIIPEWKRSCLILLSISYSIKPYRLNQVKLSHTWRYMKHFLNFVFWKKEINLKQVVRCWRKALRERDPQLTCELDQGNQRLLVPSPVLGRYALLTFPVQAAQVNRPEIITRCWEQLCNLHDRAQLKHLHKLSRFNMWVWRFACLVTIQDKPFNISSLAY